MLVESISGKELSGHKLSGKERIIHGAIGAGSLALDFTGIGEMSKAGVLAGRSVGLVEKVGAGLATKGAIRSARVFEKTAEFMVKHPDLTAKAELYADTKMRGMITQIKDYQTGGSNSEKVGGEVVEETHVSEAGLEKKADSPDQSAEIVQMSPEAPLDIEPNSQENAGLLLFDRMANDKIRNQIIDLLTQAERYATEQTETRIIFDESGGFQLDDKG